MKKKKRLAQGNDWHGWAWKARGFMADGSDCLFHWAEPARPRARNGKPSENGKWVRVKFVEVRHPNG